MISDYFSRSWVTFCDDDGVYYMRQIDRTDGINNFEGLVWFGQQFEDDPAWANVYFGRLVHGASTDSKGNRIDRWDGKFFDVPKGRVCGSQLLNVQTLVVFPNTAGCEFEEYYIHKVHGDGFGGTTWNPPLSICWRIAHEFTNDPDIPFAPPPIPTRIGQALAGDFEMLTEARQLSSTATAPGFERNDPNVTGLWRGDGGGSYYITDRRPASTELVWYAEHPSARNRAGAGANAMPAEGWANVFFGSRDDDRITGIWADVPRGATEGAGHLEAVIESTRLIRITNVTGGYGERVLRRVSALDVTVNCQTLTIINRNESLDEPSLYLYFFKIDADTVDGSNLTEGSVSANPRDATQLGNNRRQGDVLTIPPANGLFQTRLTEIPGREPSGVRDTKVGVILYAIERDRRTTDEDRASRHQAWVRMLTDSLNRVLRGGRIPDSTDAYDAANRIHTRFRVGDTDDLLGGDASIVSLHELTEQSFITRDVNLDRDGVYRVRVSFSAESRINPSCS